MAKKVKNHSIPPLASLSIGKCCFLLPRDMRFADQDIHLGQLQHTIAYAMALQYWAKWVHPPVPDQPHHLTGSLQELWHVMEPHVSFGEEEVFATMAPSNWTEVTLPWLTETTPPWESWKCCTHGSRAHLRGSMTVTQSEGQPATTATQATAATEALVTWPQESKPHQPPSDSQPICPLPGFREIAQMLRKEEPMDISPLPVITSILTQEIVDPLWVMGMLWQWPHYFRTKPQGRWWWAAVV